MKPEKLILIKSIIVSVSCVSVDMGSMYLFGKYSNYDTTVQVYLSSFAKVIFLFIGHNLITYRGVSSESSLTKKLITFFTWELFSLITIAQSTLYISPALSKVIIDNIDLVKDIPYLYSYVEVKGKKVFIMGVELIIIVKQLMVILFYIMVEIHMYKFIFK